MTRKSLAAFFIGGEDTPIDVRRVGLQPGEERRSEVEADSRVIVDDARDASVSVEYSGSRIRRITLHGDALVPIVKGIGRILYFDKFQPGILPRRLIKMTMNADVAFHRNGACRALLVKGAFRPE